MVTCAGATGPDFDEAFASIEECYRAVYEQGIGRLAKTIAAAADRQDGWLARVRCGLVALLGFFDDEPSWAHVLVLDAAPVSASLSFECRQQLHDVLGRLLDHQAAERPPGSPLLMSALTGELIVGGVFSVIRASMLENKGSKLVELAPSLMAFIVAPYLGQAAARVELQGKPVRSGGSAVVKPGFSRPGAISRAARLPIRATHRTTAVLRAIGQTPYLNNREIAKAAGLVDEGQTSKLLTRLERQGVIENVGVGASRGEPNAWLLTPTGRSALKVLAESFNDSTQQPRSPRARRVA